MALKWVVSYNVGNPKVTIQLPGGVSIRSGSSKVFDTLPFSLSALQGLHGVTAVHVDEKLAKNVEASHPRAADWKKADKDRPNQLKKYVRRGR